jgi:hypothetical protein
VAHPALTSHHPPWIGSLVTGSLQTAARRPDAIVAGVRSRNARFLGRRLVEEDVVRVP